MKPNKYYELDDQIYKNKRRYIYLQLINYSVAHSLIVVGFQCCKEYFFSGQSTNGNLGASIMYAVYAVSFIFSPLICLLIPMKILMILGSAVYFGSMIVPIFQLPVLFYVAQVLFGSLSAIHLLVQLSYITALAEENAVEEVNIREAEDRKTLLRESEYVQDNPKEYMEQIRKEFHDEHREIIVQSVTVVEDGQQRQRTVYRVKESSDAPLIAEVPDTIPKIAKNPELTQRVVEISYKSRFIGLYSTFYGLTCLLVETTRYVMVDFLRFNQDRFLIVVVIVSFVGFIMICFASIGVIQRSQKNKIFKRDKIINNLKNSFGIFRGLTIYSIVGLSVFVGFLKTFTYKYFTETMRRRHAALVLYIYNALYLLFGYPFGLLLDKLGWRANLLMAVAMAVSVYPLVWVGLDNEIVVLYFVGAVLLAVHDVLAENFKITVVSEFFSENPTTAFSVDLAVQYVTRSVLYGIAGAINRDGFCLVMGCVIIAGYSIFTICNVHRK